MSNKREVLEILFTLALIGAFMYFSLRSATVVIQPDDVYEVDNAQ